MKKIEYNNMMSILLNASKTKISNNSHRIAISKVEKLIDESILKNQKDKKISFLDMGKILEDLRIFRQIFSDNRIGGTFDDHNQKNKYQSYKDIKLELKNVKEREKRKKTEVDFYEQIWLALNPENSETIKSDIFSEILKILFSPVASSIKEISSILRQFLQAAFFLNSNPEREKNYISPITEKYISEEDIWPLEKLVKEFLGLKENILAYQKIGNINKNFKDDLDTRKVENSFKPKILKKTPPGMSDDKIEFKSRYNFFYQRLPNLIERDRLRRQVLDEMKKESEDQV